MSLKSFTQAYLGCMLWAECDSTDPDNNCPEPLESQGYTTEDIGFESLQEIEMDCAAFYEAEQEKWADDEQAGHDFYLTRNGHGAGFWDRGMEHGDKLTDACRPYGTQGLYIGDDERLHTHS